MTAMHCKVFVLRGFKRINQRCKYYTKIQLLCIMLLQNLIKDHGTLWRPKSHTVFLLAGCRWLLQPLCKFSIFLTANGMHSESHSFLIGSHN